MADAAERARLRQIALVCTAVATAALLVLQAIGSSGVIISTWQRGYLRATDQRQLLIVGTQSSGTANTVDRLVRLGLEVSHEQASGMVTSAHDGTASWLHGVRYLNGTAPPAFARWLCERKHFRTGFLGPSTFQPPAHSCVSWAGALLARLLVTLPGSDGLGGLEWAEQQLADRACWAHECEAVVRATWGCAARDQGCTMPFARTLLQARHPLRTLESLVVKLCPSLRHAPKGDFVQMTRLMFPAHHWGHHQSCVGTLASYLVLYLEAMLQAIDRGYVAWRRTNHNANRAQM